MAVATPPMSSWQSKTLDLTAPVDALEVKSKNLPAGVNVTMIEGVRALVETRDGPTEIQIGDWLVRCPADASTDVQAQIGLKPGQCLRLPYDQAAQRLT